MKNEHIAINTENIETIKKFYEKCFDAKADQKYKNFSKGFQSYFLTFNSGRRLETMQMEGRCQYAKPLKTQHLGPVQFAIFVGSETNIDTLTNILCVDRNSKLDNPRRTRDGFYESVVLDPEGNRIESMV